jgi:hypothetical protein
MMQSVAGSEQLQNAFGLGMSLDAKSTDSYRSNAFARCEPNSHGLAVEAEFDPHIEDLQTAQQALYRKVAQPAMAE